MKVASLEELAQKWADQWQQALAIWSRFTKLNPPILCLSHALADKEGLTQSFAMIRLVDKAIVIDLEGVRDRNLEDFAVEILAHEIGHHILAPANLTDHARILARMRKALPTLEHMAPQIANLYEDLLINDRLKRISSLRLAEVYLKMVSKGGDALWNFYMRTYEILWSMKRGSLALGTVKDGMEGDAQLASRIVRSYAHDWMRGAAKYAMLCLPYLLESEKKSYEKWLSVLNDTKGAGKGGMPDGLSNAEPEEDGDLVHPADDPDLSGIDEDIGAKEESRKSRSSQSQPSAARSQNAKGQARQPFEYGDILRASGLDISDHEVAVRFYREQAIPYLVNFPKRKVPQSVDPLPEGLEPWSIGESFEQADWLQSILQSGEIIPGMTVVQRVWGDSPGNEPEFKPVDLDIYIDSSGSMPNPQQQISYLTLAGAIVAVSALRVGARVQATLWSGKDEFLCTNGFVRDEKKILEVMTGFFGGGTQFPIHVLRKTYEKRTIRDNPVHILVISDDGITTMFDKDELGNSGHDIAKMALKNARGGGTMVLQVPKNFEQRIFSKQEMKAELRWQVYSIQVWEDLISFAKNFSKQKYDFS